MTEGDLAVVFRESTETDRWCECAEPFPNLYDELECMQGIPDFVATTQNLFKMPIRRRRSISGCLQSPMSARLASLAKARAPRTTKYLQVAGSFPRPAFQQAIKCLRQSGIIRDLGNGIVVEEGFVSQEVELWAFELKLENWRRALYQAMQYKAFAHKSVVVMPHKYVHRVLPHLELFENLGIGLLMLENSHDFEFVVQAKKSAPSSLSHYYYALGKMLSRTI